MCLCELVMNTQLESQQLAEDCHFAISMNQNMIAYHCNIKACKSHIDLGSLGAI